MHLIKRPRKKQRQHRIQFDIIFGRTWPNAIYHAATEKSVYLRNSHFRRWFLYNSLFYWVKCVCVFVCNINLIKIQFNGISCMKPPPRCVFFQSHRNEASKRFRVFLCIFHQSRYELLGMHNMFMSSPDREIVSFLFPSFVCASSLTSDQLRKIRHKIVKTSYKRKQAAWLTAKHIRLDRAVFGTLLHPLQLNKVHFVLNLRYILSRMPFGRNFAFS